MERLQLNLLEEERTYHVMIFTHGRQDRSFISKMLKWSKIKVRRGDYESAAKSGINSSLYRLDLTGPEIERFHAEVKRTGYHVEIYHDEYVTG